MTALDKLNPFTKKASLEPQIIDLDAKSAVTIFTAIAIPRDNPKEVMGAVDLENYISQAIWKLFDRCRREAAERLEVDEVDLLLTDARIMRVKVDGEEVINPHGFLGRELELLIALTMVRREKFEEGATPFEGGSLRAYLLARRENLDQAIYVGLDRKNTTIYGITREKIAYLSEFDWGINNIETAIANEFELTPDIAAALYLRYAAGTLSARFNKKMEQIFYASFNTLINGLVMSIKNFFGLHEDKLPPIYLYSPFPVPLSVYRKRFTFDGKTIRLIKPAALDLNEFLREEANEIYRELNQLAKRRIKWLMPTE
ncbi:MAG: hypothetical protein HYS89_02650 [Candidatus Colwellbacteria bacterium]|nr:hypothetical protein [Candidatus Colwellbacteria bacterium]